METLKVWFTDFWPEWKDEDFITPILQNNFNIELTKNNPDVLFHSIFNRMSDSPNYNCKKVLFLGENRKPNEFNSNYSISFEPHSDTNYRLPLWQAYILKNPSLLNTLYNSRSINMTYEHWCAFIVSNSSNFFRNSIYHQLNSYKHVSSYGKYLTNNLGLQQVSQGRYWRDAFYEYFTNNPHKFMFAIENTPSKYYCTEKLMNTFLVDSMPIYWGDTRIGEDWNEKAFINGTKIDIVEAVKKIDKDYSLYKAMKEEPVFTDDQKIKLKNNLSSFEEWLIEIIKK